MKCASSGGRGRAPSPPPPSTDVGITLSEGKWRLGLRLRNRSVVLTPLDYHTGFIELEEEDIRVLYDLFSGLLSPELGVAQLMDSAEAADRGAGDHSVYIPRKIFG